MKIWIMARAARVWDSWQGSRVVSVHLATQTSKISARRYGYAHAMNGLYLWRKGSQGGLSFLRTTTKALIANVCGLAVIRRGVSRVQRWGCLRGSMLGFRDIVFHGAQPERIEYI